MERFKNIAVVLVVSVLFISLLLNVKHYTGTSKTAEPYRDTIRTTFVDTIHYLKPVPKDSTVIKYVTVKVPVPTLVAEENANLQDSATIELPITQTVYSDSTFTAYVSGFNAHLDSCLVYPKTQTIVIKEKDKASKWNVGVHAGYGMTIETTPKFTPYIGIGISYNLFNF